MSSKFEIYKTKSFKKLIKKIKKLNEFFNIILNTVVETLIVH